MANQDLKLLGLWVSPFVHRVEWALKLKGVHYEYIEEDIKNKSPLLLKYNPVHQTVPVLVHNGKVINESIIILEYINETWKENPIFPEDPYERALVRFWANFGEEKLLKNAYLALISEGEEQEKFLKSAIEAIQILDEELKGKKFFGGESIGYLDIVLGWASLWLAVWEEVACIKILDPIKFPSFNAWSYNFLDLPIVKDNLPPRDKMLVWFNNSRQTRIASTAGKIA